jgi:hypothetical protein
MKQKNQYIVLGCLVLIAAVIWYFNGNAPAAQRGIVSTVQEAALLTVENPHLRTEEIAKVRKTEYKSSGRNIFSSAPPPPPVSIEAAQNNSRVIETPQISQPPVIPPLPPLPVKFFGYGTIPNGTAKRAFFTDGEDVYVVGEGDVLLNRFRIVKVGNASLEYEEISSGRRGTAMLEEQPAGPSA